MERSSCPIPSHSRKPFWPIAWRVLPCTRSRWCWKIWSLAWLQDVIRSPRNVHWLPLFGLLFKFFGFAELSQNDGINKIKQIQLRPGILSNTRKVSISRELVIVFPSLASGLLQQDMARCTMVLSHGWRWEVPGFGWLEMETKLPRALIRSKVTCNCDIYGVVPRTTPV